MPFRALFYQSPWTMFRSVVTIPENNLNFSTKETTKKIRHRINSKVIRKENIKNGNHFFDIPHDFKDIYIKVCDPEEGVILFQDKCTLKSKGLKPTWTRDN